MQLRCSKKSSQIYMHSIDFNDSVRVRQRALRSMRNSGYDEVTKRSRSRIKHASEDDVVRAMQREEREMQREEREMQRADRERERLERLERERERLERLERERLEREREILNRSRMRALTQITPIFFIFVCIIHFCLLVIFKLINKVFGTG